MQPDLDTFPQQELPARATQLDAQAADAVHALDHDELYDFQHPSSVHKSALAGRHLAPSQAAGHPGHWPDTPLPGTFSLGGRVALDKGKWSLRVGPGPFTRVKTAHSPRVSTTAPHSALFI